MLSQIRKRDGKIVLFNRKKIVSAIYKSILANGSTDKNLAESIADKVIKIVESKYSDNNVPNVEHVQDIVEKVLIEEGHTTLAKSYILYREKRREVREEKDTLLNIEKTMDEYLQKNDWRVNENANVDFSLGGLILYISGKITANYWLNNIYNKEVRSAHINGDFHLHDLSMFSGYCSGWSLRQLILEGFGGVPNRLQTVPAKHFDTINGQMVNFLGTLQNEWAGAQAFSSFDTYLSAFVKHDNLDYKQVKQQMQRFMFNIATPSRWGTQCVPVDTEALTENGWKKYNEIRNEKIATFNIKIKKIEYLKPLKVTSYDFDGYLINLKNRTQDQLVTPDHKVVRKIFNSNKFELIEAEKLMDYKTPIQIPTAWDVDNKKEIDDNLVKLFAWLVAEGSFSDGERKRVYLFQSKKNERNCNEIRKILKELNFKWDESEKTGGFSKIKTIRFRLNSESSKKIRKYLEKKKIPDFIKNLNVRQIKLFIETYIKGDGCKEKNGRIRIYTKDKDVRDSMQELCAISGFGTTILQRKNGVYTINLIRNKITNITSITKKRFKGKVWCPTTKNGTFIARRNGKVFITGNTPFINTTLDWIVPEDLANQPAIVGGKPQSYTYSDCQEEMDLVNKAFIECMVEGDASKRIFTFPIPTYNVTKDFDWNSENSNLLFEMTAKYGIPYFQNFINSDLKPSDVRSMCCRLQLNLKELRNKGGGGLFGAGENTGSVGVVTINMPRIGYLAGTENEFLERLGYLMEIAKQSLEVKRKVISQKMDQGLLPYTKRYLGNLNHHFSTIGLIGMNEACLNLFGETIATKRGREFSLMTLEFMREKLTKFQEETKNIYNLEATPGEGSLAPEEKVLISQSDPKFIEIGPLVDRYLEKNKENIQLIGNSEVLKIPEGEMFSYGFSKKNQKIRKYPVTALIRHQGKSMYEITTVSGRKIKVTGQHSVFGLSSEGEPHEILVKELRVGSSIAIPKKIEMEEINKEFNLIQIFKDSSFKNKLYGIFPLEFIEKLINNLKTKEWCDSYYKYSWKDIKFNWRKRKIIPLKLIYDLKIDINKKILESSKVFYRLKKNTKPIKAIILIDKNFGFLIGGLLSEGWISERSQFTNTNKKTIKKFFSAVEKTFGKGSAHLSSKNRSNNGRKTLYTICLSKIIGYFLNEINVRGKSYEKKIPEFLFFSSLESTKGILEGFHLGDGSVYQNKKKNDFSVSLYTNSKELIEGLNLCLLRAGILAKIRKDKKSKYNSKWRDGYKLSVTGADNLKKYFNFVFKKKIILNNVHSGREIIPEVPISIKTIMKKYSIKPQDIDIHKDSFNKNIRINRISIQFLKKIIKKLSYLKDEEIIEKLRLLINSDIYWDKIKEIKKTPTPRFVYDLEVDIENGLVNNFLGGEGLICLHNTSYRLAKIDKNKFPDIITAGKNEPYYTNSSMLPVNYTDDVFESLELQDELQTKYTGGTVMHCFIGERLSDSEATKKLVRKIAYNFRLPYYTITPTFSICQQHGYIKGEMHKCPQCNTATEVYSRVVGYLRPVQQWNKGKKEEFIDRKTYDYDKSIKHEISEEALSKINLQKTLN